MLTSTAGGDFLAFCMKLGNYKGLKLTEPDFQKKLVFLQLCWAKCFFIILFLSAFVGVGSCWLLLAFAVFTQHGA